ncbi:MAG: DUF1207 domain-containing protein [Bacteroidota bacterium]
MSSFKSYLAWSLFLLPTVLFSQRDTSKITFLPSDRLFQPIIFDPTESQAYGTIAPYWEEGNYTDDLYLPFGMGFYKGFLRWNTGRPSEIGFDFSAHTQFIWTENDGKIERNLLNSDFKVSVMWNKQLNDQHSYRLRFYHVSSHLGDDYVIRNGITSFFPNPNNYEQLDFTWSFIKNVTRYYAGLGMVVRPETIRKRFSSQFGSQLEKPLSTKWPLGITAGFDLKILEQHDFNPSVKAAFGLRIGQSDKMPLRIVAEYYRGNLPYSPFEFMRVQWIGAGLYFSP